MHTKYISAAHAVFDPENDGKTLKAELRVGASETLARHMEVTVNGYNSGRELMNITLAPDQVRELQAACSEFLDSTVAGIVEAG